MNIPLFISKRTDILIKNNYSMITASKIDCHIVIYYIDTNKCKIILRRLDSNKDYDDSIYIKLEDELIDIGIMKNNIIIKEVITHTKLIPIDLNYEQLIPKVIIQTGNTEKYKSLQHFNSISTFLELNPEYEYKYFTDIMCREFIKNNFDKNVLLAYDILNPGAYRADLFRYCYLHIHGGCYFDCKMILRQSLRNLIEKNQELIVCQDRMEKGYYNAIILTCRGKFTEVINNCVTNILQNKYAGIWDITGPCLFYSILNKQEKSVSFQYINIKHDDSYMRDAVIYLPNKSVIITNNYLNYGKESYKKQKHYIILYEHKEIFFKKIGEICGFQVFILNPNCPITFSINNNKIIFTSRIKCMTLCKIIYPDSNTLVLTLDMSRTRKIQVNL
jgi:mannosyltransferase OCH1-like enzyme